MLLFLENHLNILLICSAERSKYELRVRSYRNDKKQLDSELDKAIQRLKDNADRDELMTYDNQISVNQVVFPSSMFSICHFYYSLICSVDRILNFVFNN